jgi:hypothetical protein
MISTRRRWTPIAFSLSFALLVLVPLLHAAEAPKLVGTWDAVASTPQGSLPIVITVKIVEGQPRCEVEVAAAKQTVSHETLEGGVLTMKVSYDFGLYDVTAKVVDGDALEGTWQGGGYSGAVKGTRRP